MINIIKKINEKEYELNDNKKILIYFAVAVISGVFGFIYETLFYRIDLGYFVKRGTTFGPWIPIYAFGGCGILEFVTGYILYQYFGIRLWDYNTEIWNFGNIGGYICLRSVMFFGFSGLLLIYVIMPILKNILSKLSNRTVSLITIIPFVLFVTDMIISNFVIGIK